MTTIQIYRAGGLTFDLSDWDALSVWVEFADDAVTGRRAHVTIPAALLVELANRAFQADSGQASVGSSLHRGGRGIVARAD
jgi:hypothetical protein|tara:strand:- start:736 stop:978 length:243 start_codon:yes stop_codon:yes gene_type:complete